MTHTKLTQNVRIKCHNGYLHRCTHTSETLGDLPANFSVYVPPSSEGVIFPCLYFLSGLTCTDENFITKGNAFKKAAEFGIAIVVCDTSPRDSGIPGEDDSYDLGSGAGFYLNATQEPWKRHYRMHDYICKELPEVISKNFENIDTKNASICGHSMGGHGALITAMKQPGVYKSVSVFAPICNPIKSPLCQKAYKAYLGDNQSDWAAWDACELAKSYSGPRMDLLIHIGKKDEFMDHLKPQNLIDVLQTKKDVVNYSYKAVDDYDHGYFFLQTFIDEHLEFHLSHLK